MLRLLRGGAAARVAGIYAQRKNVGNAANLYREKAHSDINPGPMRVGLLADAPLTLVLTMTATDGHDRQHSQHDFNRHQERLIVIAFKALF